MGRKTAILIPCLNEELTVGKVVRDFRHELPEAEIHVFDNHSTDATAQVAEEAGALVHTEHRRGKGNVVQSMFQKVDADIYVMVDGDDTYPAEAVHDLIDEVARGEADMVVGSRFLDPKSSFRALNRLGNHFYLRIINFLFGAQLTDVLSGYRAMSRRFVKGMPLLARGFQVEVELTIKSLERGFRLREKPCRLRDRPMGSHSKICKIRDGYRVTTFILGLFRVYHPLATYGGLAALLLGLALGLQLFGKEWTPAWPALALCLAGMASLTTGLVLDALDTRFREIDFLLGLRVPSPETPPHAPRELAGASAEGEFADPGLGDVR